MKYGIKYGREVGPMKMYMEVYIKKGDTPETYDTVEEAEARVKDLGTNNPIAHGTYKVVEMDDEELKKFGL